MPLVTRRLLVSSTAPESAVIAEAAEVLRRGGLVAFPTESVYGLGANALSDDAVRSIFLAKGRPSHNPVIVHVASIAGARELAAEWHATAQRLAEHYWPGPLTLVVPKRSHVPDAVTAGGTTVAIRCPRHAVARALIEASGLPLAAPSANRSNRISATTAEHVLRTLDGRIDMVLDGGPAIGGIESTVIDMTTSIPRVLRPGLISERELHVFLGIDSLPKEIAETRDAGLRSPGMLAKHYAPLIPVEVTASDRQRIEELAAMGQRIGWIVYGDTLPPPANVELRQLPDSAAGYAAALYDTLYDLEQCGLDMIVIAEPPRDAEWAAIHDRLRRASART